MRIFLAGLLCGFILNWLIRQLWSWADKGLFSSSQLKPYRLPKSRDSLKKHRNEKH